MKRKDFFIVAAGLMAILLLAVIAGCANPAGKSKDVTSLRILLNNRSVPTAGVTVHPGGKLNFKYEIDAKGGAKKTVTWSVSGNKSKKTTIDRGGRLSVSADEPVGNTSLYVIATSDEKPSVRARARVKVTDMSEPTDEIPFDITTINTSDGTSSPIPEFVLPGTTLQLAVEDEEVTWKLSGNSSSSTSINDNGQLVIGADESGTITIKVTAKGDKDTYIEIDIIVTLDVPPPNIPSYTLTYGPFTGPGSITGPATAAEGDAVTLNIVASGAVMTSLTVEKIGGMVQVTGVDSTTRTFTMPSSNVVITATFEVQVIVAGDYFSKNFDTSICSFYDKFDGSGTNPNANGLDRAKWGYDDGGSGFGNNEQQYYDGNANAVVRDGMLSLRLEKKRTGNRNWTSAKVWTSTGAGQPFSQTYGRFEAKIRLVSEGTGPAVGMWPAFWMMPVNNNFYGGGWPRGGEIDIMEMKGRLPRASSSTLHWRPNWPNISDWQNQYRGADVNFPQSSTISDWHVYGVQWQEDAMIFLFDGMEHVRITRNQWHTPFYDGKGWADNAPFDKPFYLIFNFACGGSFDSNGATPPDAALPARLDIEWVRVYTKENNPWTVGSLAGSGYTTRGFNN